MKHVIVDFGLGRVEPVYQTDANGNLPLGADGKPVKNPIVPEQQQRGNPQYKNGTVGNPFMVLRTMPYFDLNDLSNGIYDGHDIQTTVT